VESSTYAAEPVWFVPSVLPVSVSLPAVSWGEGCGCGCGTWVRNRLVGGWHTVGCLRDQMPLSPELVLILLGGGWVGFWA
jgi:hypothetical protein